MSLHTLLSATRFVTARSTHNAVFLACFEQFSRVLTVNAVHSRWLVDTFNASIPLIVPSKQREDASEGESKSASNA